MVLGAACIAALASTGVEAQQPTTRLSRDDARLYARLLAAADGRVRDTAIVDEGLRSASPLVRRYAALVIGQNGIALRSAHARALLADPDTAIAANAAFSLGLLRDSSAVDALAAALTAPPGVAEAAAWALGEIGAPARTALVTALEDHSQATALAFVLVASAKLRPLPVAQIAPHLQSLRPAVRWGAAYALSRTRDSGASVALLEFAPSGLAVDGSDSDADAPRRASASDVRAFVARALGQGAVPASHQSNARERLHELSHDVSAHVRVNAYRSLASYGVEERDAMLTGAHDGDANVRIAVAQSLAPTHALTAAQWANLWDADSGFTYRSAILNAAARAGMLLDVLADSSRAGWRRSADWRARAAVAEAAAGSAALARRLAIPLTRDGDGRVRAAAFATIAQVTDSSALAADGADRAPFLSAVHDNDVMVRTTALGTLARAPRAAELVVVVRAYERARADGDSDARLAALWYIARAWRSDSAAFDGRIAAALRAWPVPDPPEREVVRDVPAFGHWRGARGTTRPLSWYEQQVRRFVEPALTGRRPVARIITERGTIELELRGEHAPLTVANFVTLAQKGFYRGTRFHRVVPNFVAQDGDPRGDGNGGPGHVIRDELNRLTYDRGTLGMALSGPDTGGSQYFITHAPQPHLDGHYTIFGRMRGGFSVLDAIVQGDRILDVRVR